MKRSASSQRWLQRQANDPFVKKSQQEGFRSRAVYKLMEINEKDQLLKPNMTISLSIVTNPPVLRPNLK